MPAASQTSNTSMMTSSALLAHSCHFLVPAASCCIREGKVQARLV
eukprot:CAMPEP_0204281530 /NCGR_PEP_ID=MMETSP0468-20130131/41148_1 /ASSEMBLY_ACC=CAM_ASM_000383 /TAXON_ID=2969 /ORGANISM="Oxyrrhis marina" /LENGTH=44 /DNA_ID= /DNA_START= /DNA_END= /DNA_ORIENTATION=